jgi:hypothetical protein
MSGESADGSVRPGEKELGAGFLLSRRDNLLRARPPLFAVAGTELKWRLLGFARASTPQVFRMNGRVKNIRLVWSGSPATMAERGPPAGCRAGPQRATRTLRSGGCCLRRRQIQARQLAKNLHLTTYSDRGALRGGASPLSRASVSCVLSGGLPVR